MPDSIDANTDDTQRSGLVAGFKRTMLWGWRSVKAVLLLLMAYALLILVGLYPVGGEDGAGSGAGEEAPVEVFVFSGAFHSDIILPVHHAEMDWFSLFPMSDFAADVSEAQWIAIGWGDEDFYLHTPTWNDLKFSTACDALLIPSSTVMHVAMVARPTEGTSVRRVLVSPRKYRAMVAQIRKSIRLDAEGQSCLISGYRYGQHDAFYEAVGSYHAFRTCNCWVGEVLRAGGVKCGWFTPLPKTVFWHLPESP